MEALYQIQHHKSMESGLNIKLTWESLQEASLVDRMLTHNRRNEIVYGRQGTSFCVRNSIGGNQGAWAVTTGGHYSGFLKLMKRLWTDDSCLMLFIPEHKYTLQSISVLRVHIGKDMKMIVNKTMFWENAFSLASWYH